MNIIISLKNTKHSNYNISFGAPVLDHVLLHLYNIVKMIIMPHDLHIAERREMSLREVGDYSAWMI